jgi:4-hydroxy-L-threonine phosphate dehydrogenase PdxA
MKNLIAIVAGEPESINSEIIAKAWKKINFKNRLFIIGNHYVQIIVQHFTCYLLL